MSAAMPLPVRPPCYVDPVIALMEDRWRRYGNVQSIELQDTWRQIVRTFNRKFQEFGRAASRDWHVLSPATGTGKTETTICYAAALPRLAPGCAMLIVTRFKAGADYLVSEINALAGEVVAVARHSDAPVPVEELRRYPVAVVTHAAFELALKAASWEHMIAFDGAATRRGLIVIDEAINLLEITKLNEDDLSRLVGAIPGYARDQWPAQVKYLEDFLAALRTWKAAMKGAQQQVMRSEDRARFDALFGELPDFAPLRACMRQHRFCGSERKGTRELANAQLQEDFYDVFGQVCSLVESFVLFAKQGKATTFNSAKLILPDDAQGCVILDATASTNRFYDIANRDGSGFTVHKHAPPVGARSYGNVILSVSRTSGTGRDALTKTDDNGDNIGEKDAARLLSWIESSIDRAKHRKVFIVCHKDNAHHFAGAEIDGLGIVVGHYGNLDGRNDFRDCTVCVAFGLPYRDPLDATLTFFAMQGTKPDAWFKDRKARRFEGFADIREELYIGWTITDLVQAANRTAMRKVIDEDGNCPGSELYLLIPRGRRGDHILAGLQSQLPGCIDVRNWTFQKTLTKKRKVNHKDRLKTFLKNLPAGAKLAATKVRAELRISATTWDRLVSELRDGSSELALELLAAGVRYALEREGRRTAAYFVK